MFPNFGSNSVQPANVSFMAYKDQAESFALNWPFSFTTSPNVTASLVEISMTLPALTVTMPSADQCSVGQMLIVRNIGSFNFDILDFDGGVIVTVEANPVDPDENVGNTKYLYVVDNSTSAGEWHYINYGTGTSSVVAGDLAGPGLKANAGKLETDKVVVPKVTDFVINDGSRAIVYECTAALTITLPAAAPSNGFYFEVVNAGTAVLVTIDPNGNEINGSGWNLVLSPGGSVTIISDGSDWVAEGLQSNFPVPLPIELGGTGADNQLEALINITDITLPGQLIVGAPTTGEPTQLTLGAAGKTLISTGSQIAWGGVSIRQFVFVPIDTIEVVSDGYSHQTIFADIVTEDPESKVFILFDVYISLEAIGAISLPDVAYTLKRDGTSIYIGETPTTGFGPYTGSIGLNGTTGDFGFQTRITGHFLDTPDDSNPQYTLDFVMPNWVSGQSFAINQKVSPGGVKSFTGSSSMTLIEIGGL